MSVIQPVVDAAEVDRVLGTRVLRWFSAHQRVVDALVAVTCLLVQVLGLVLPGAQPLWPGLPLVILSSVLLLWRRRYPRAILVAVALANTAGVLLPAPVAPVTLPAAVALYSVAAMLPTRTALSGYAVLVGLPASGLLVRLLVTGSTQAPSLLEPLALLALAAGVAARGVTQRRAALTQLVNQRLTTARVVERQRIAAEMHDVVAHSLSTMISLADGASSGWERHPERSARALEQLGGVGRSALGEMNRVLQVLREGDAVLDQRLHRSGHNVSDVEEVVEVFRSTGMPVTLTRSGGTMPEQPALVTTVYRIVQESLTNVLRYAVDPTRVEVGIDVAPGIVAVRVTDDGRIDTHRTRAPSQGSGHGLPGIAARAAAYGGASEAGPCAGGGWSTSATLHIERGAAT
ncbi:Signal transduction histidine kinase [Plantibacter flavus]|uniref:histidine kinase n=1 Tax=Plantibacter flavus TaxID=150123 RepID=A0A3N2C3U5_9MICO|nr:histidine kinase [Plantibacter flavus]ROR81954.1 signal transduction histidine kinase [Plantibacter flavus]SMG18766.1 Signal transduction histidine kinase [Plantibacter flavus]